MADIMGAQLGVQKRARQQLSCVTCRAGKLRCNRQQPCDQCLKRSKDASCQYLPPPARKKKSRNTKDRIAHLEGLVVQLMNQNQSDAGPNSTRQSPGTLTVSQQQQEHGNSVSSGTHRSSVLQSPATSAVSAVNTPEDSVASNQQHSYDTSESNAHEIGQLKISNGETSYVGSLHWEAILENVQILTSKHADGRRH